MARCKYIIFNDCIPVIFSEAIPHADMANYSLGRPTSAGFCEIYTNVDGDKVVVTCFGESTSLKLKALPVDDVVLGRLLNGSY